MGRIPTVQSLTQAEIDALQPDGNRRRDVWLNSPEGLGVFVHPSGRKVYVLRFRAGGRQRYRQLGPVKARTLDEARKLARKLLGQIADGIDPIAEDERRKSEAKAEAERLAQRQTLAQYWTLYLDDAAKRLKPRTLEDMRRLWNAIIGPTLGSVPLEDLRRSQIAAMHRERSSTPVRANRALAHLRAALSRAIEWGILEAETNPAGGIRAYPEESREFRMEPDQWGAFLRAIDTLEAEGEGGWKRGANGRYLGGARGLSPFAAGFFRLAAYSGMRRSELVGLRWREVDFDNGLLALEDSKTGRRVVFLGPEAVKELRRLRAIRSQDEMVFESPHTGKLMTEPKCRLDMIRAKAGLPDFSLHGIRHAVGSHLADLGFPESPIIQGILGHRQRSVTGRYVHAAREIFQRAVTEHEKALLAYRAGTSAVVATVNSASDEATTGAARSK